MELCKLCRHEKDALGLECETRTLVHAQTISLGVEVSINACNGFERHEAFREEEEDE